MTIYAPYVIERSSRGERSYDIFSRLLMDRIVFLGSSINDDVANVVIAQLLFLQAENPERDINIYINSPGGSVYAGLAIYDTIQYMTAPVATICMGMAASMGAFLLAAGTPGKRSALPNSRIMIHQPSGGSQGTASRDSQGIGRGQRIAKDHLKDAAHCRQGATDGALDQGIAVRDEDEVSFIAGGQGDVVLETDQHTAGLIGQRNAVVIVLSDSWQRTE